MDWVNYDSQVIKKPETYLRSFVLSQVYHTDDNSHLVLEKEC